MKNCLCSIIRLMLCVILIGASLDVASLSPMAAAESAQTRAVNVLVSSVDGTISTSAKTWYRFTAKDSGVYEFYTTGNTDTYGSLHKKLKGKALVKDDDSGKSFNFHLAYMMSADQTVYIQVKGGTKKASGLYTLNAVYPSHTTPTPTITPTPTPTPTPVPTPSPTPQSDPSVKRGFVIAVKSGDADEQMVRAKNFIGVSELFKRNDIITDGALGSPSWEAIRNAMLNHFNSSDKNDVNYVLINCHGAKNGSLAIGSSTDQSKLWVTPAKLRSTLDQVPGKIVLFIEACYCGVLIDKSSQANDCIETFIKKFKQSGSRSKAGELVGEKYNVLCSTSKTLYSYECHHKAPLSLSVNGLSYYEDQFTGGIFIYALGRGGGWNINANKSSAMMADANRDGKVTMNEICQYTRDFLVEYFTAYTYYDDDGSRSNQTPVFYIEDPDLVVFSGSGSPPAPAPTPSPKYRGLVMGVGLGLNGSEDTIYLPKEAECFSGMLQNQSFNGQKIERICMAANPSSRSDALKAIEDAFDGSNKNDVNYLYIHCLSNKRNSDGKLLLWLGSDDNGYISSQDLRRFLDQIPGKMNLILVSTYSGDIISKSPLGYSDSFIQQFIRGNKTAKSGEFIDDKYNIICACSMNQRNIILGFAETQRYWDISSSTVSEGAGWVYFNVEKPYKTGLKADSNKDGEITMREIYDYAEPRIKAMHRQYNIPEENGLTQLCVYPYDDSVVFARN